MAIRESRIFTLAIQFFRLSASIESGSKSDIGTGERLDQGPQGQIGEIVSH
ncbi:hypothetical protein [Mesorhizobium sp. M1E.F.Ca.ET.041.01.1.1]|uniref:hypothetical protein n=1 Tax=Mesorhizobium sp. M1E.F.Ca.ET.041.01.1.1 TaxID=2496759 RepID=UPI00167ADCC6|nr:hypothetical protein [Mesorhizobium sp. M1E.F.Ca.ET.041.01.1.1]